MEHLLGDEYAAFLATHDQPRTQALRTNLLKTTPQALASKLGIPMEPVPWAKGGFYYPEAARPGRHPYHAAGLYYIQEPSAMAAAQALAPQPGERVLDLCAAPGGKATHLAMLMANQGLLVANEIHPKRARILAENLERMGVTCAAVLQEEPDRLAGRFAGFFDRILVDAPCSGEGMFRKLPEACDEWNPGAPVSCSLAQREILSAAVSMLRPGGYMLYSTCTFSPDENEQVLLDLLRRHPEMAVAPPPEIPGAAAAQAAWAGQTTPAEAEQLGRALRLWPHRLRGEGHFMVLLRKTESTAAAVPQPEQGGKTERPRRGGGGRERPGRDRGDVLLSSGVDLFRRFCADSLQGEFSGPFLLYGDALYQVAQGLPDLNGLRVIRPGLYLGDIKKNRFEPSHALALAVSEMDALQRHDLPADGDEVLAYLRGEALPAAGESGWTLVTVDGFPLGWAKAANGLLKNHYPKGLRWLGGIPCVL